MDKETIKEIINAFKVFAKTYPTHAPALIYNFECYLEEISGTNVVVREDTEVAQSETEDENGN